MNYFGMSINKSSVLAECAGADIENGAFLAVKYDGNGNIVLNDTEGAVIAGILLPETTSDLKQGQDATIQIKDIGYAKAGAAVKKGAELMADTQGRLITATNGKFIVGFAVSNAEAADEVIQVDIRKCGYKPAEA